MAEFSSYIGHFRAQGEVYQPKTLRNGIKRNRPRLSCVPCWARKLKCDRGRPCETCVKRGDEASCSYESSSRTPQNNGTNRVDPQEKLLEIEKLVMQMMNSEATGTQRVESQTTIQPQFDNTPLNSGSGGHLHQNLSETRYVGSTHWSTILDNIQELKTTMHAVPSTYADYDDPDEPGTANGELIFGSSRQYSLHQILSESLPPKVQVDRRLSAFFNAKMLVAPYIHIYQFQRQYENFWKDPLSVSPLWISIMFSLCCLAVATSEITSLEPTEAENQQAARIGFANAAAHCLVLGEYSRPQYLAVEALLVYAQCKHMFTLDPSRELCIMLSVISRLCYFMGYHRDPDNFGHFTIFESEMRRRAWSACRQFDLMVSFQFGLPSSIIADTWDTKTPRNLLDSDFDEKTAILPPPRPQTDPSPILYFVVKHELLNGFIKVCIQALTLKMTSQREVMDLDTEIRQNYSTIPECLRMMPMAKSLSDPPFLIISRIYIEFLHQKSLCILHRRHMAQDYEYSTKACLNAAIMIITHLIDVNNELKSDGQLRGHVWAITSFIMNDFLLAVMILCLSLSKWRRKNEGKRIEQDPSSHSQLDTLKKAYNICVEKSTVSKEARRVVAPVRSILAQFELEEPYNDMAAVRGYTAPNMINNLLPATVTTSGIDGLTSLSLNESQLAMFTPIYPDSLTGEANTFEEIFKDLDLIDWPYISQYLASPNLYDIGREYNGIAANQAAVDGHNRYL